MNRHQISFRDKLETMWYFHKGLVLRCSFIDAILTMAAYYLVGHSTLFLPAFAFPLFGIANYCLSTRQVKKLHVELPISFLVASTWATFIAFTNLSLSHPVPRMAASQAAFQETMTNIFFYGMVGVTLSLAFAIYTLWSGAEMETHVQRFQINGDQ